ncbi:hypothetical protein VTI74DRAFT_11369 [Chaetomium olivicolor]
MLITPAKTPSPIFSRLIAAMFAHFATKSSDELQPSEFCALMAAAGYSIDFPPLQISTNDAASPADLHQLDTWLANWYRSFPLDHRMGTREFPPPPPVQPHNGRIRLRDQLAQAIMHPPAPVIPNGLPLLSQRGLEQYFISQAMEDPSNLSARVNNILRTLPPLTDRETGCSFETGPIPRECFPLTTDPEVMHRRMLMEQQAAAMRAEQQAREIAYAKQRMEQNHIVNMARTQAYINVIENDLVVAISGSSSKFDWLLNLNNSPAPVPDLISLTGPSNDQPLLVHTGFADSARLLMPKLEHYLRVLLMDTTGSRVPNQNMSAIYTGHSAGGAVASILHAHFMTFKATKPNAIPCHDSTWPYAKDLALLLHKAGTEPLAFGVQGSLQRAAMPLLLPPYSAFRPGQVISMTCVEQEEEDRDEDEERCDMRLLLLPAHVLEGLL